MQADDQDKDVMHKIHELERLARKQEAELHRLNDEKEKIRTDMALFRKESRHEMDTLL